MWHYNYMNQEETEALGVVTGTTSSSIFSISAFLCEPNQWHKQMPSHNILLLQSEIKNIRIAWHKQVFCNVFLTFWTKCHADAFTAYFKITCFQLLFFLVCISCNTVTFSKGNVACLLFSASNTFCIIDNSYMISFSPVTNHCAGVV